MVKTSTTKLTRHHRRPVSLKGSDSFRNISWVSKTRHAAWHTLFGNMTPQDIARTVNSVYLDPDYEFIVRKKR